MAKATQVVDAETVERLRGQVAMRPGQLSDQPVGGGRSANGAVGVAQPVDQHDVAALRAVKGKPQRETRAFVVGQKIQNLRQHHQIGRLLRPVSGRRALDEIDVGVRRAPLRHGERPRGAVHGDKRVAARRQQRRQRAGAAACLETAPIAGLRQARHGPRELHLLICAFVRAPWVVRARIERGEMRAHLIRRQKTPPGAR